MKYIFSEHQKNQVRVINKIEKQIKTGEANFSTVSTVNDFDPDPRICLTSIHFPHQDLINKIHTNLIKPLKREFPEHYYYLFSSLHMTIKNIRVINDPPHFTAEDVAKVRQTYAKVIPEHHSFNVYFYRLFFFPRNVALMGTTDPELDEIILHVDRELKKIGVPDDKKYANPKYFFSNMTLARFSAPAKAEFKQHAQRHFNKIKFKPYTVDSVTLIKANASLTTCERIQTWKLK